MQKTDQAKQMVEQGLAQLAEALEQGQSQALRDYLNTMARFHRYSIGNVMLILLQCPQATHVAGYHTWKTLGRQVKMGERGILILAPVIRARTRSEGSSEIPPGDDEQPSSHVIGFRAAHVFDVSQTEGQALPELATAAGSPGDYTERLRGLVRQLAIELEYSEELGTADGVSQGGLIKIREGLTPAQEFAVLVHELAHELLHKSEATRAQTDRSLRELEAEAVSYVVSEAVGLDTQAAATDYIQLYRGDAQTLATSLEAIRGVATRILSALLST